MGGGASSLPDVSEEDKAKLAQQMAASIAQKTDEVNRRASLDDQQKQVHIYNHIKQEIESHVTEAQTRAHKAKKKGSHPSPTVPNPRLSVEVAQKTLGDAPVPTVTPKSQHEFRRRRLTYAGQRSESVAIPPENDCVFRSREMGEEGGVPSPFPASIMGTYSCHGIEPSFDEDNVIAKSNQDRGCVVYPFLGSSTCALLCVFDGHGEHGDAISNFAMVEMPKRLAEHSDTHTNPARALRETFVSINESLEDMPSNIPLCSGTTAVVILIRDGHMWIASCGDSRAILAVGGGEGGVLTAAPLTVDHNPDVLKEKERIMMSGGYVSPPPEPGLSARVWLDKECTQIGLAMARSIGDYAAKRVGVTPEPEVTDRPIGASDKFIVLASDGVWEFLSNDDVVTLVHSVLRKGGPSAAVSACESLIARAANKWQANEGDYRDDITAIVLSLPCFSLQPPSSVGG